MRPYFIQKSKLIFNILLFLYRKLQVKWIQLPCALSLQILSLNSKLLNLEKPDVICFFDNFFPLSLSTWLNYIRTNHKNFNVPIYFYRLDFTFLSTSTCAVGTCWNNFRSNHFEDRFWLLSPARPFHSTQILNNKKFIYSR